MNSRKICRASRRTKRLKGKANRRRSSDRQRQIDCTSNTEFESIIVYQRCRSSRSSKVRLSSFIILRFKNSFRDFLAGPGRTLLTLSHCAPRTYRLYCHSSLSESCHSASGFHHPQHLKASFEAGWMELQLHALRLIYISLLRSFRTKISQLGIREIKRFLWLCFLLFV